MSKKVAEAVEKELDHIAAAIDLIADKLSKGGRLIYTCLLYTSRCV